MNLGKAGVEKRADEITHRLGPEPIGQGRRPHDVAKQHRDLFHFAGKRSPEPSGGFGYEWPARGVLLQIRPAERRAALAAKPVFGRIARAARRTRDTQRRATLSAELHPGEIVGATPRAPHAEPPPSAGDWRLRFSPYSSPGRMVNILRMRA